MSTPRGGCFWGGVCSAGRGMSAPGGVSTPGGCLLLGGCLLPGGSDSGGCLLTGGCLLLGGGVCSQGGVCFQGGVCSGGWCLPACTQADIPPVNRITDTSKNITLATTSLRPVITPCESEYLRLINLQAEKRAHHNALERKRRDHIKESFHSLRDSIPSLQGEKVSTAEALI